jgi:hypothetical protein
MHFIRCRLLAIGKHSNNKYATDLPTPKKLATLFHTPRSTLHGGGAHFWVVPFPLLLARIPSTA